MNHYEIWVDLAPGANDLEFVQAVQNYLNHFRDQGKVESYTIRRRKFGFSPPELGEFYISIAFRSLAQLDEAFFVAATRDESVEQLHREVYSRVCNFKSALYRDFPDEVRKI
ncbi:MAG TPA: DUF6614 family protein [Fimbriimonadaceae bacterium]|nr:DUF6614 family protein [Fimbriimonadaceae bacterium]